MTIPYFEKKPSLFLIFLFVIVIPLLHIVSGFIFAIKFHPYLQLLILLIPSAWAIQSLTLKDSSHMEKINSDILWVMMLSCMISLFINLFLPYWNQVFPIPREIEKMIESLMHKGQPWGVWIDIVSLAMVPAVCEEFYFRGVLQTSFCHYLSPQGGRWLAAFFFAFYHFNPWYFPFYVLLGLFFGWIFIRTRHLGLAVFAHFLNNFVSILLYHYTSWV